MVEPAYEAVYHTYDEMEEYLTKWVDAHGEHALPSAPPPAIPPPASGPLMAGAISMKWTGLVDQRNSKAMGGAPYI